MSFFNFALNDVLSV